MPRVQGDTSEYRPTETLSLANRIAGRTYPLVLEARTNDATRTCPQSGALIYGSQCTKEVTPGYYLIYTPVLNGCKTDCTPGVWTHHPTDPPCYVPVQLVVNTDRPLIDPNRRSFGCPEQKANRAQDRISVPDQDLNTKAEAPDGGSLPVGLDAACARESDVRSSGQAVNRSICAIAPHGCCEEAGAVKGRSEGWRSEGRE
jgi:hypothetical protein